MSTPQYLSPHFTLEELTRSQVAARLGIRNGAPRQIQLNLKRLCELILEPLHYDLGNGLQITSGYRCPELNQAIGGSAGSQHLRGLAADMVCRGLTPLDLCHRIDELHLPFDQLIYEGSWVHVSVCAPGESSRGELLTARFSPGRKTTYTPGLPFRPGDAP